MMLVLWFSRGVAGVVERGNSGKGDEGDWCHTKRLEPVNLVDVCEFWRYTRVSTSPRYLLFLMAMKLKVFPVWMIVYKAKVSPVLITLAMVRIRDGEREDPEECHQRKQATLEPS
jgi:hypothetical protein